MSDSPATPAAAPRLIRIYLSAPTDDMQSERELLTRYVLPELNDRCGEMNVQFALVDVRRDPALATTAPSEKARAALAGIDECRPWFLGLLGDKCDDIQEVTPELCDEYPWLAEQGAASLVELELEYGVLRGEGPHTRLVYLRDDRTLRDMTADNRAKFFSEEIADVERLESLKVELRAADIKLVDGYPCRWDADDRCVTDLEEFGKQLVDDLHDAVLLQLDPAMTVSVLEEEATAGAAVGMIGSGGGGPQPSPSAGRDDDDEEMDFGMEEVLDVDNAADASSSASAIEGVEMLDFLDDELDDADQPPLPDATAQPKLDLSAAPGEPEQLDVEEHDVTELEDAAGDEEWSFDDVSPVDDEDADEPSDVGPSEPTVRRTEKTTAMPAAGDDAVDEFDPAAPTVQPSSLAAKPKKKKSSLPMILIALAALLLVGAGVGGLYFAGLLPQAGDGGGTAANGGNGPNNNASAGNQVDAARASRVDEHSTKLSSLVQAAKPDGEAVDSDKLAEAQAYLQDITDNEPDLLSEQPIADLQSQLATLAGELEQQTEAARVKEFRTALESARALQDAGLLEEAGRLATNDDERNLVAALAAEIDEHERQQAAAAAAAEAAQAKAAAAKAIANSVEDAAVYRQQLEAYIKANPDDARSTDFQKALDVEAAALESVRQWNEMLRAWGDEGPTTLSPAVAAQRVAAAEAGLKAASALPGAEAVSERLPVLQAIAARSQDGKLLWETITASFDNPAAKASLVFGTKDGRRYFMTAVPTRQDGNFLATYIVDTDGTTKEVMIAPADVDPAATGRVAMADMAAAVVDQLAKIDELGWETAILSAASAVQSAQPAEGEKVRPIDPVTKTQWLTALLEGGSQGSQPLAAATADARKALSETGVDAAFNWADPQAAAAVREKCAAALAKLPPMDDLQPTVDAELKAAGEWNLTQMLSPAGVLLKDDDGAEGRWTVALKDAPSWPGTSVLSLLSLESPDGPLIVTPIGSTEVDVAKLNEGLDPQQLVEGRVVYFVVPFGQPALPNAPLDDGPELDFTP